MSYLEELYEKYKDLPTDFTLSFEVSFLDNSSGEKVNFKRANHYVDNALHHIFLIMNITAPGCLSYFSRKLYSETSNSIYHLDPLFIDFAWEISLNRSFLNVGSLDLQCTLDWYQALNIGYKQIAKSGLERAFFALLNFSVEGPVSPANLLWLAHALESLYGSPRGNIAQTLIDRSISFLEVPENRQSLLKEKVKDFYSFRTRLLIRHNLS